MQQTFYIDAIVITDADVFEGKHVRLETAASAAGLRLLVNSKNLQAKAAKLLHLFVKVLKSHTGNTFKNYLLQFLFQHFCNCSGALIHFKHCPFGQSNLGTGPALYRKGNADTATSWQKREHA